MPQAKQPGFKVGFYIGAFLPPVLNVIVIIGSVCMLRRRSYGAAMTAAVIAILPCSMCCISNTGFGIWAIIVLRDPVVKRAFR